MTGPQQQITQNQQQAKSQNTSGNRPPASQVVQQPQNVAWLSLFNTFITGFVEITMVNESPTGDLKPSDARKFGCCASEASTVGVNRELLVGENNNTGQGIEIPVYLPFADGTIVAYTAIAEYGESVGDFLIRTLRERGHIVEIGYDPDLGRYIKSIDGVPDWQGYVNNGLPYVFVEPLSRNEYKPYKSPNQFIEKNPLLFLIQKNQHESGLDFVGLKSKVWESRQYSSIETQSAYSISFSGKVVEAEQTPLQVNYSSTVWCLENQSFLIFTSLDERFEKTIAAGREIAVVCSGENGVIAVEQNFIETQEAICSPMQQSYGSSNKNKVSGFGIGMVKLWGYEKFPQEQHNIFATLGMCECETGRIDRDVFRQEAIGSAALQALSQENRFGPEVSIHNSSQTQKTHMEQLRTKQIDANRDRLVIVKAVSGKRQVAAKEEIGAGFEVSENGSGVLQEKAVNGKKPVNFTALRRLMSKGAGLAAMPASPKNNLSFARAQGAPKKPKEGKKKRE